MPKRRNRQTQNKREESNKLEILLGFELKYLKCWNSFTTLLFKPADPSSLAITRILFGALMMLDIPAERGLGEADLRWGDDNDCRFPLFNFLKPLPLEYMCMIYFIMWLGALGIMLGAHFRISGIAFILPYWYIFLLDKTRWNNHSYLYGIVAILLTFTDAHHYWSIDALFGRVQNNTDVPIWNYGILRFQFILMYFYAGLKKTEFDWLNGYSMSSMSHHWVFDPFRILLTTHQIDLYVIHIFGFLLDLTVGFLIYFNRTRPTAFLFLTLFHLMNSQMFSIGLFPYVCLATMPLFCDIDWPKKLLKKSEKLKSLVRYTCITNTNCYYDTQHQKKERRKHHYKKKLTAALLMAHVAFQTFLPYSHFITKGYNNWTNGLYGYSWDMMVHTWETVLTVVKVVDKDTDKEIYLDPEAWATSNSWNRHGDMVKQYADCIAERIRNSHHKLDNFSLHLDVWTSLNKRFQQRMFDPRIDILSAEWSVFKPVPWLLPMLSDLSGWRRQIDILEKEIVSWANNSNALFLADFPGLYLENYIHKDLTNVSLTVLRGGVIVEMEDSEIKLTAGERVAIPTATFHKIHTTTSTPACYMYTFYNLSITDGLSSTKDTLAQNDKGFLTQYVDDLFRSVWLISRSFLKILYHVPMMKRVKIPG
ncbi:gamma-glutamyl carboxylase [Rhodnius prolixus]|uniref:gamma-glutamyl carboxylase n=1 Tax=Rhodnius prolixus TaxID=13249 RepID=UPI003D18F799